MQNSQDLVALALSLRRKGDFAAAKQAALRALEKRDDDAAAWFNLGASHAGLGDAAASEAAYRRALELRPGYAEAWSNLGGLLAGLGRQDEAIAAYRNGIGANDRLAPIWSNLCNALCEAGRFAEAEEAGRKSVQLEPALAAAWVNLGRALLALGRHAPARDACQRAVDLAPELPDSWSGLANALMRLRRFEDAIAAYRKAVSLQPGNPHLHANLGVALRRIGLPGPGIESLRSALEIDPRHGFASWNLANALLERGELAEGWKHYEARWRYPDAAPRSFPPKGDGPPRGRVFLWSEQGIGDEILYAGMAAELASEDAQVTLEADRRLVPLFRRSFPGLAIISRGTAVKVEDFEHVIPLGDLGAQRRTRWCAFPEHHGYLVADPDRAVAYRSRLQALLPGTLIVGIAWRSSNPELGPEKSAPLSEWCPVLRTAGAAFVNLQYGDVEKECAEAQAKCGARIVRLPEPDLYNDIDGLAALQAACDLVITTSNVTAHLAGALGRPAWVLLPQRIGRLWYWFHERTDSPWYPSLALIAQSRDGDWTSAIASAAGRLRAMLQDKS